MPYSRFSYGRQYRYQTIKKIGYIYVRGEFYNETNNLQIAINEAYKGIFKVFKNKMV